MSDLHRHYYSREIRISAHDRTQNEPQNNFNIDCPSASGHWTNVHAVKVISATIPNTAYNVHELADGTNPSFTWTDVNGTFTVTVSPGQYTITEYLTALTNAITAEATSTFAAATWTNTVDANTGRVTISASSGSFTSINSGDYDSDRLDYYAGGYDLPSSGPIAVGSGTYTFPFTPRLYGLKAATIHCPQIGISTNDFDRKGLHYPIGRIPIPVEYGEVATYHSGHESENLLYFPSPRYIGRLKISLRDDREQLINLNGHDWSFVIRIYYRR